MDKKKINLMWSISLFLIAVITLVITGTRILGTELPDMLLRILGGMDLIALPVLAYSSVRKAKDKV